MNQLHLVFHKAYYKCTEIPAATGFNLLPAFPRKSFLPKELLKSFPPMKLLETSVLDPVIAEQYILKRHPTNSSLPSSKGCCRMLNWLGKEIFQEKKHLTCICHEVQRETHQRIYLKEHTYTGFFHASITYIVIGSIILCSFFFFLSFCIVKAICNQKHIILGVDCFVIPTLELTDRSIYTPTPHKLLL